MIMDYNNADIRAIQVIEELKLTIANTGARNNRMHLNKLTGDTVSVYNLINKLNATSEDYARIGIIASILRTTSGRALYNLYHPSMRIAREKMVDLLEEIAQLSISKKKDSKIKYEYAVKLYRDAVKNIRKEVIPKKDLASINANSKTRETGKLFNKLDPREAIYYMDNFYGYEEFNDISSDFLNSIKPVKEKKAKKKSNKENFDEELMSEISEYLEDTTGEFRGLTREGSNLIMRGANYDDAIISTDGVNWFTRDGIPFEDLVEYEDLEEENEYEHVDITSDDYVITPHNFDAEGMFSKDNVETSTGEYRMVDGQIMHISDIFKQPAPVEDYNRPVARLSSDYDANIIGSLASSRENHDNGETMEESSDETDDSHSKNLEDVTNALVKSTDEVVKEAVKDIISDVVEAYNSIAEHYDPYAEVKPEESVDWIDEDTKHLENLIKPKESSEEVVMTEEEAEEYYDAELMGIDNTSKKDGLAKPSDSNTMTKSLIDMYNSTNSLKEKLEVVENDLANSLSGETPSSTVDFSLNLESVVSESITPEIQDTPKLDEATLEILNTYIDTDIPQILEDMNNSLNRSIGKSTNSKFNASCSSFLINTDEEGKMYELFVDGLYEKSSEDKINKISIGTITRLAASKIIDALKLTKDDIALNVALSGVSGATHSLVNMYNASSENSDSDNFEVKKYMDYITVGIRYLLHATGEDDKVVVKYYPYNDDIIVDVKSEYDINLLSKAVKYLEGNYMYKVDRPSITVVESRDGNVEYDGDPFNSSVCKWGIVDYIPKYLKDMIDAEYDSDVEIAFKRKYTVKTENNEEVITAMNSSNLLCNLQYTIKDENVNDIVHSTEVEEILTQANLRLSHLFMSTKNYYQIGPISLLPI